MPDLIDYEFAGMYAEFVESGGLDRIDRIDEDWERKLRQQCYCNHGVMSQKCTRGCRKNLPIYGNQW